MKTFLLLACLCVLQAQGLFFRRRDDAEELSPAVDVRDSCARLGERGLCGFYDCLEERYPCGARGYTLSVSRHFCAKIDQAFPTFTEMGKFWLNRTSICLMSYMLPVYHGDSATCADIRDAGTEAVLSCNERTHTYRGRDIEFCDFIQENGAEYNSLMGMEEMRKMVGMDTRVWRTMIEQAVTCGLESLTDRASSFASRLFNRISSFFSD